MHLDGASELGNKLVKKQNRDRDAQQRVPAPTDLAERMIAFQRRNAACVDFSYFYWRDLSYLFI
jgi:hypothetical protein